MELIRPSREILPLNLPPSRVRRLVPSAREQRGDRRSTYPGSRPGIRASHHRRCRARGSARRRTGRARSPATSARLPLPRQASAPAFRLRVRARRLRPVRPSSWAVPIDAVDTRCLALPSQQDEQPRIAKASPLVSGVAQPRAQLRLRRAPPVADHLAIGTDEGTGPMLRQAHHSLQMRNGFVGGGLARQITRLRAPLRAPGAP